jgi:ribonuclease HI
MVTLSYCTPPRTAVKEHIRGMSAPGSAPQTTNADPTRTAGPRDPENMAVEAPPPEKTPPAQRPEPPELKLTKYSQSVWATTDEATIFFMDIPYEAGSELVAALRKIDQNLRVQVIVDLERQKAVVQGSPQTLTLLAYLWYTKPLFKGAILVPSSSGGTFFPKPFTPRPLLAISPVPKDIFNEWRRSVEYAGVSAEEALNAPGPVLWFKQLGKKDSRKNIAVLIAPASITTFENLLDNGIDLPNGSHLICEPYVDTLELCLVNEKTIDHSGEAHNPRSNTPRNACKICYAPTHITKKCPAYPALISQAKYEAQISLVSKYCSNQDLAKMIRRKILETNTNASPLEITDEVFMKMDVTKEVSHEEQKEHNKKVSGSKRSKEAEKTQSSLDQFLTNKGGGGDSYVRPENPKKNQALKRSGAPPLTLSVGPINFQLRQVPGDGNCFWYSINQSAFRNQSDPSLLKQRVAKWCHENNETYKRICTCSGVDPDSVMAEIEQNYAWASYIAIAVTAVALNLSILVVSKDISYTFFTKKFLHGLKIPFDAHTEVQILFHQRSNPKGSEHKNFDHFAPVSALPEPLSNEQVWKKLENKTIEYDTSCLDDEEEGKMTTETQNSPTTTIATTKDTSISTSIGASKRAQLPPKPPDNTPSPPPKKLKRKKTQALTNKSTTPLISPPDPNVTKLYQPSPLRVWSWNTNSLKYLGRSKEISDRALELEADILCLQETTLYDSFPHMPSYNIELGPALEEVRQRGIATLIKSKLVYSRRRDIETAILPIESVVIQIAISAQDHILLINSYFNPDDSISPQALTEALDKAQKFAQAGIILVGDFNSQGMYLGGTPPTSQRGKALDTFLENSEAYSLVSDFEITFIRGSTLSCLDGVIASQEVAGKIQTTLDHPIGPGHYPIITDIQLPFEVTALEEPEETRNTKKVVDINKFLAKLELFFEVDSPFESIDQVQTFVEAIKAAMIESTTEITNGNSLNWWNSRCKKAASKRNAAFDKLKNTGPNHHKQEELSKEYERLQKEATEVFKTEKRRAQHKIIFNASRGNHNSIWKSISMLAGNKWTRKQIPTEQARLVKAQKKADELCKVFEQIQKAPDLHNIRIPPNLIQAKNARLELIQEWEVNKAISKLKPRSSPGSDQIPVFILKTLWRNEKWRHTLLRLFNQIYKKKELFSPFKHAIVHPVPKPGQNNAYRPISLLSQLGKILERVLANRLQKMLKLPNQFGCRPGCGSKEVLARLQHWAVKNTPFGVSIFMDISKAYDRVIPKLVVHKLNRVTGISKHLVEWIESFLQNRSFQVRVSGILSPHIGKPDFGLPQGSPLSIPLWHVFFMDIPHGRQDNIFMDDVNINVSSDNWEDLHIEAQEKLFKISKWADANGVRFDAAKTKVVSLDDNEVHLKLKREHISYLPQVPTHKYLGVYLSTPGLDERGFSLRVQIRAETKEFNRRLKWIQALRPLPLSIKRTAYLALVRSKLAYAILLTIRDHRDKLEKMQKRGLEVMSGAYRSTPYDRLLQILNIPSMFDVARAESIRMRAKLLTLGGIIQDDYLTWIEKEDGEDSEDTPFGMLQSETLMHEEGMFFAPHFLLSDEDEKTIHILQSQTQATLKPELPLAETIAYCDGSYNPNIKQGASGFYIQDIPRRSTHSGGIRYSNVYSSFQAELLALKDALFCLNTMNPPPKSVLILTDSLSLLSNIPSWSLRPEVSTTLANILDNAYELIFVKKTQISLAWIPGHKGILGNELADKEARDALQKPGNIAQHLPIESNYFHIRAKQVTNVGISDPKLTTLNFSPSVRKSLIRYHMTGISRTITRILTDHHGLNGRMTTQLEDEDDLCVYCRLTPISLNHLLRCPHPLVQEHRHVVERKFPTHDYLSLPEIISQPKVWTLLVTFLYAIQLPI